MKPPVDPMASHLYVTAGFCKRDIQLRESYCTKDISQVCLWFYFLYRDAKRRLETPENCSWLW